MPDRAKLATLTPRQMQAALLVARGLVTKEIATEMGCKECTVVVHLRNVYAELGIHTRVELSIFLRDLGFR